MENIVIQTSQTNIQVVRDALRNQEKYEENCLGQHFRKVHDVNDDLKKKTE